LSPGRKLVSQVMDPMSLPPGYYDDRSTGLYAVIWIPFPLIIFLLGSRLYVRAKISGLGLDDVSMFAAFVRPEN
jgi:hypothetical protein